MNIFKVFMYFINYVDIKINVALFLFTNFLHLSDNSLSSNN